MNMFNKKPKKQQNKNKNKKPQTNKNPFHSNKKPDSEISKKTANQINEILRRLRTLEERYTNLRKKNQLSDQNMLKDSKRLSDDIKVLQSTINDLKKEISEVNNKIRKLHEEISQTVPKRKFDMISKYVDFWEPMNYVQKGETKKIIQNIIEEIRTNQKLYKQ